MTAPQQGSLAAGIALMLGASLFFATLDSFAKLLMMTLPVVQVLWARYLVQTLLMAAYLGATGGGRFLHTRHLLLQLLRGLTLLSASLCVCAALAYIPVGDVTALVFFSPVIITVLSVLFLGERIGLHRTLAIVAGLAGVLLIIEPGFGTTGPFHLLALAGAGLNSAYLLLTRRLAGPEESAATQFNTTAAGTLVLSIAVFGWWQTPTPAEAALLVLIGTLGAVGHFALVKGFSHAPASLLSPFMYSQVPFAALYSVFMFGDRLRPAMVAGAVLLVASGLYIWWRERLRGRPREH